MTFLGAQPSRAMVRLGSPEGPLAQVIVDSGSNITLVSSKLLEKLSPTPKPREGQNIWINQVTGRSSTNQYVSLEIFFKTPAETISLKLEAYIVKEMNAPFILGNDFADQYSLSIIRENRITYLKLGDSGHNIPLDSSVDSAFLEIMALRAEAMAALHRKNNHLRKRQRKPTRVLVREPVTIHPWSIKKIPIRFTKPIGGYGIFNPRNDKPSRFQNATFIDSIVTPQTQFIHVTNDTDAPIRLEPTDLVGNIEPDDFYDSKPTSNITVDTQSPGHLRISVQVFITDLYIRVCNR